MITTIALAAAALLTFTAAYALGKLAERRKARLVLEQEFRQDMECMADWYKAAGGDKEFAEGFEPQLHVIMGRWDIPGDWDVPGELEFYASRSYPQNKLPWVVRLARAAYDWKWHGDRFWWLELARRYEDGGALDLAHLHSLMWSATRFWDKYGFGRTCSRRRRRGKR